MTLNIFSKKNSIYRLSRSRTILKHTFALYKKRKKSLAPETVKRLEEIFASLDSALLNNDRAEADKYAKQLEAESSIHLKKTIFDYGIELGVALVLALIVAIIVRQMWFELYEIPTGSMRPTFEEQDRLTVTKTAFGINTPLMTEHLYFDPELVQRTGIVILSGDNIDLPDTSTTYFWLFPTHKRYIKRMIGKPGDSLYFYGGLIYGVDKDGHEIKDFENAPWLNNLEHVPYLTFDGKITKAPNEEGYQFKLMNLPLGKIIKNREGFIEESIYVNGKWSFFWRIYLMS